MTLCLTVPGPHASVLVSRVLSTPQPEHCEMRFTHAPSPIEWRLPGSGIADPSFVRFVLRHKVWASTTPPEGNGHIPGNQAALAYSQRVRVPGERSWSHLPRGATAFGLFLAFGTTMALLGATTLLFSGTALDRVWRLNPRAHQELAPFGKTAGVGFALLAAALALTAVGWFRRRSWGWRLAVALVATQVLGNLFNLFRGRVLEGAVGITIAAALLLYLLSQPIRFLFRPRDDKVECGDSSF